MKRISFVVNPQGVRSDALTRREERIGRGIEQAIASAQDSAAEAEEKADAIIDDLGKVGGADQTGDLQSKINEYLKAKEMAWAWNRQVEHLNALKTALDEEVEVTVNPTIVKVVQ